MQLNPKALGLAWAIICAAFWLVAMGVSLLTGIGEITITTWGSWHPFFSYSWTGLVVVVVENIIAGFVGGYIFAWLYNKFLPKTTI
jgi:hypothetical protein